MKRAANMDLLRILVMFYVLVIHANYISLPDTTVVSVHHNFSREVFRLFVEVLCVCAVNVFILISGWFGIHPSFKKFSSFIFQILFYWLGFYFLWLIIGLQPVSLKGFSNAFFFSNWDWFIKAYIVLYILAPALNCFINDSDEKIVRTTIILFFAFECSYGWLGGAYQFFCGGYGTLSFIGLYILAGYIRRCISDEGYAPVNVIKLFKYSAGKYLCAYFIISICGTSLCVLNYYFNVVNVEWFKNVILYYDSLFMILNAVLLLIAFSKMNLKHRPCIQWISVSTFAVYLFHSEPTIREYFNKINCYIFEHIDGICSIICITLFLLFVYMLSILLDKVRIYLWRIIVQIINKEYAKL